MSKVPEFTKGLKNAEQELAKGLQKYTTGALHLCANRAPHVNLVLIWLCTFSSPFMHFLLDKHTVRERNISGLMNEYKGRDTMKNSVKRTTAAILATMMIGTGMYAPIADHGA